MEAMARVTELFVQRTFQSSVEVCVEGGGGLSIRSAILEYLLTTVQKNSVILLFTVFIYGQRYELSHGTAANTCTVHPLRLDQHCVMS